MGFKSECIKAYQEQEIRIEKNSNERKEELITRLKNKIKKDFEGYFKMPFKEEYLIQEEGEFSPIFYIKIDELKMYISQGPYNPQFYLKVHCRKCNELMSYRQCLKTPFLNDIGRILSNLDNLPEYNITCNDCTQKEKAEGREKSNLRYEKQREERKDKLIQNLADAFANILKAGGYRDLYNEDLEE